MCEHEELRTVGNRVFCKQCGAELPIEFLISKNHDKVKEAEKPKRTRKKKEAVAE